MQIIYNGKKDIIQQSIILIDGMNLFHRQYYAFNKFVTGTAYGFVNSLLSFTEQFEANKFIVCWEGGKLWRKTENKDYKKNRPKFTDEEKENFHNSLQVTKKLLAKIGILQIAKKGFEADDIIAKLVFMYNKNVVIVSNDKDFSQLVNDKNNIYVCKPTGKGVYCVMRENDIAKIYGVPANKIAKLLALMGDRGDGVAGVKGIGQKNALKILNTNKPIKEILDANKYSQFKESLGLVNLKMDKFNFKIVKDDIVNLLDMYIGSNYKKYLNRLQKTLNVYKINRYSALQLAKMKNKNFVKNFITDRKEN